MSKTSSKILNSKTVGSAAELSAYIGISPRSIREHVASGVIVRAGPGRYLLKRSIAGYAAWLRSRAAQKHEDPLEASRAKLIGAKADIAEAKAKSLIDTLVDAKSADAAWQTTKRRCREMLGALPARIDARLPGRIDAHGLDEIKREALLALLPLADEPKGATGNA